MNPPPRHGFTTTVTNGARPAGVSPHVRLTADLRTPLNAHAILKALQEFATRQAAATGNPAFATACLELSRAAHNVSTFF